MSQQIHPYTIELYRDVFFSDAEGREVLKDILNDCLVFPAQELATEEDRIKNNVGRTILAKLGVQLAEQADAYISAIANMAPPNPKETQNNGR